MLKKITPVLSMSILLTAVTIPGISQANTDQTSIEALNAQTAKLQHEVSALQAQLAQMQQRKKVHREKLRHHKASKKGHSSTSSVMAMGKKQGYFGKSRYLKGVTVTTSPFFGPYHSAWDSSDLLENASSLNEDLTLLKQRAQFDKQMQKQGVSLDNRPIVVVSGALEGQVQSQNSFTDKKMQGDINLSTAELDIMPIVGSWANGFFSIDYDDSPASNGNRSENSRLYLERGFLTIGNLNKFPLYFSVGQMYVPFGRYSTDLITDPLTQSLSRVLTRTAVLGFSKSGVYAQVYGFTGNNESGHSAVFRQFGSNVGYQNEWGEHSFDAGVGYISNLADSQGMQGTGAENASFEGFADTDSNLPGATNNNLKHSVGAVDVHAIYGYGPVKFIGEYMSAVRKFDSSDLSFNGKAAEPKAMQAELSYSWDMYNIPFEALVSYGHTWEALALNLPENSYSAVVNTSIWKNTYEGIEYRHDVNYKTGATSGGAGLGVTSGPQGGGNRNTVIAQFGVYF